MERITSVDSPFGVFPDLSFDHTPTVREMRERAVLIMHKALSVQWFTTAPIVTKTSVSDWTFEPYEKYAGVPYTGPNTAIFGFLQFLDEKTGQLRVEDFEKLGYTDPSSALNALAGSSCSGTAAWSIAAVCNSVKGMFQCYYMVPKNGWLKLGPYEYDTSIDLFGKDSPLSTDEICAQNGAQVMFESYCLLEPADIVVYQDRKKMGHTMMAIGSPVIFTHEDGTIDGEKSYVFIQDQRWGGWQTVDATTGALYKNMGRVSHKLTLQRLFELGYIPATTAEFQGLKPYETPWVKLSGSAKSVQELKTLRMRSNYHVAHVRLTVDGEIAAQYAFTRRDVAEGLARDYPLAQLVGEVDAPMDAITLTATLPSGEKVQLV